SGTAGPNRPRARSQFSGRRPASSARQVVLSLAGVRGTRSSQPARYAPVRLTRGSTIETAAEKAGLAPKLLWIMLGTQLVTPSFSPPWSMAGTTRQTRPAANRAGSIRRAAPGPALRAAGPSGAALADPLPAARRKG